jgi:hypothetical protein
VSTSAITEPYQLDARRCISYLNIDTRARSRKNSSAKLGEWLYGCDICQDVCPWNHKAPPSSDPLFQPRFKTGTIDLRELLGWTEDGYRTKLRGSPLRRVRLRCFSAMPRSLHKTFRIGTQSETRTANRSADRAAGNRGLPWKLRLRAAEGAVQHVVVCWLKEPGVAAARQELILSSRGFVGKIPGLSQVSAGVVCPSTRPAVDSSFDVAIVMTFESADALQTYSKHPAHLAAIEKTLKPLVARYVVYDFFDKDGRGHRR